MSVALPRFPGRGDDVHKGEVGRVVVVGGRLDDVGMVGAPALVANGGFRVGVGLVQIVTPRAAMGVVGSLAMCATTRAMDIEGLASVGIAGMARAFDADVVAIGPGLWNEVRGEHVVRLLNEFEGGIVVDADGLNALAGVGRWRASREGQVVVTPHPGEMKRLTAGLGIETRGREETATVVSRETGAVVVLKGAGTVVSDGRRTYVNETGHSGMATAGAGDVLTGVIAGLMGQKMDAFDAAVLGVHVHGRAGELAGDRVGRVSVMAVDIVESLGLAIAGLGGARDAT